MPKFTILGSYLQPISIEVEADTYDEAHDMAKNAENWDEDEAYCDFNWDYNPDDAPKAEPCTHSGYITFHGSMNYPHEIDHGPFCPACDKLVAI